MLVLYFLEMVTFFKSILRRRLRGTFKINWNNCYLGQRLPLRLHIYAVTKPLIVILYWGSNRKSHFPPCTIVYLPCHLLPMHKVLLTLNSLIPLTAISCFFKLSSLVAIKYFALWIFTKVVTIPKNQRYAFDVSTMILFLPVSQWHHLFTQP